MFAPAFVGGQGLQPNIRFDFCGINVDLPNVTQSQVAFSAPFSVENIQTFYAKACESTLPQIADSLIKYRDENKLDDWFFYQLIRKTAQTLSPKASNYERYTLYKWFLLKKTGYDAVIRLGDSYMLLYVQANDNIYNIPSIQENGKQYVCLNYHDYGSIDFKKEHFTQVDVEKAAEMKTFSYVINKIPNFQQQDYQTKELAFNYNDNSYHFKIKVNPQLKTMFVNYPVQDYATYFKIPLSNETYNSLIPVLKDQVKKMNVKTGIDYLMHFTRYAFMFEPDMQQFGTEKRFTPEQTLLYDESDCEDRAALFFYLVKEIYNMPMIVLAYDNHITIAVKFDKAIGTPILYKGEKYTVCEPTPQKVDLLVGEMLPELQHAKYEIAYAYTPAKK